VGKICVATVVISTQGHAGGRVDRSGPALGKLVELFAGEIRQQELIPDHQETIERTLCRLADSGCIDLLLTTGGTGCSPDDVTPEATLAVIDREVPGIAEEMRCVSRQYTRYSALSRAVAGIRGSTLIINFPGSPKSIDEIGQVLVPLIEHLIDLLRSSAGSGHLHKQGN